MDRTGERWKTNEGYWVTITDYFLSKWCVVTFDETLFKRNATYNQIKKGEIKYPFHPSVFGVGFIGVGRHKAKLNNSKTNNVYTKWCNILQRCYDEKFHLRKPTYKGCTISPEWHNFQNFANWYKENFKTWMDSTWDLDKDILSKENKTYSPETCCFVPREINYIFRKGYKTEIDNIKILAEKYKERLTKDCYKALINYK